MLPISVIIATRNRAPYCSDLLSTLLQMPRPPAEILICDSSTDDLTEKATTGRAIYLKALQPGAATQRNQAFSVSTQPFILFLDDDIQLEPGCIEALWETLISHPEAGGATATITNETYSPPGKWTRRLLRWFEGGQERGSYAGKCIGPGMTFRPANLPREHEPVEIDWMGTGCTLYRREYLPDPPFPDLFVEASLCEDLALSLTVGRNVPLYHVPAARFLHLNAGGSHKKSAVRLAEMGLINRHYIMTRILGRNSPRVYLQFAAMLLFGLAGSLLGRNGSLRTTLQILAGYSKGLLRILRS